MKYDVRLSSTKTPRIAYILGEFPSISETFIINELLELKRQGVPVCIFALTRKKEKESQQQAVKLLPQITFAPTVIPITKIERIKMIFQAPLHNFPALMRAKKISPNHYFLALWLAQLIRDKKIIHLHAHFPEPSLVAMITSLLTNIPYSFTVHSHLATEKKYGLAERVARAQAVVTVGNAIQREVTNICPEKYRNKIHVVRSGLNIATHTVIRRNLKSSLRHSNNQFKIISVGRLVEHKGLSYLIKAIKLLTSKYPNTRLEIIGDGHQRSQLLRLINRLGLSKIVTLCGFLPHGNIFYHKLLKSDAFVLPCVTDKEHNQDGLPVSILEAMMCGLPVVATNIAAIPEAVDHHNGFLVPEKNAYALAEALDKLHALSVEERHMLGRAGQRRIWEKFSLTKNVQILKHILISDNK